METLFANGYQTSNFIKVFFIFQTYLFVHLVFIQINQVHRGKIIKDGQCKNNTVIQTTLVWLATITILVIMLDVGYVFVFTQTNPYIMDIL